MIRKLVTIIFCCLIFNIDVKGQQSFFHQYVSANGITGKCITVANNYTYLTFVTNSGPTNVQSSINKVDSAGNILQSFVLENLLIEEIINTKDSCVIIAGYKLYNNVFSDTLLLIKFDSNLVPIWSRSIYHYYNLVRNYMSLDIIELDSTTFLLSVAAIDTIVSSSTGINQSFQKLIKFNLAGEILQSHILKGSGEFPSIVCCDLNVEGNNKILISGWAGNVDGDTSYAILFRIDSSLNVIESHLYYHNSRNMAAYASYKINANRYFILSSGGISRYTPLIVDSNLNFIQASYYATQFIAISDFIYSLTDSTFLIASYGGSFYKLNDLGEIISCTVFSPSVAGFPFAQYRPYKEGSNIYGTSQIGCTGCPIAVNYFKTDTSFITACNYHFIPPFVPPIATTFIDSSIVIQSISLPVVIDSVVISNNTPNVIFNPNCISNNDEELENRKVEISFYPNPTHGEFYIEFEDETSQTDYDVFFINSLGQVVYQTIFESESSKSININQLKTGFYIVKLVSRCYNVSYPFKLLKL